MRRVVVTGIGVATGLGCEPGQFWERLLAGHSAIIEHRFDGSGAFPVRYAAPITDYPARSDGLGEEEERRTRFGLGAALQAVRDAGDYPATHPEQWAVVMGSGVPERDAQDPRAVARHAGARRTAAASDRLATQIARQLAVTGPVINLNTACAGAAHAIGTGFRLVRRGEVDCAIVGGADSVLNLPTMVGLYLLGAVATREEYGARLCRPFDLGRSGLVAAEGGAVLVLEEEQRARRRGARIYAAVTGFGTALDAYRATAPHPEGDGAVAAMQRALADGRVAPEEVDCINAHGTSTPLNDRVETIAIRRVFAAREHYRRLMVTANKSMLGHLIAAAGAPEIVASVLSLYHGAVPPTINLDEPDPACDLDYVPHTAREARLRHVLSNSFGFGGLNAAVLVSRCE